jgi:feruloyl esterase
MKLRRNLALSVAIALFCQQHAGAQSNSSGASTRPEAIATCAALSRLEFPDVLELAAEWRPAAPFETQSFGRTQSFDLPAFCRVTGTVAPAISFEVWLPDSDRWNGRFLAVGGGGYTGTISHSAMAPAIQDGYVTASTDTGHQSGSLDWLSDRGLLRDYGYRGISEMSIKAETIVQVYYGRDADYRYFNGCSTGGRQGLMEAQRNPEHYDGVVAGDPVNAFIDTRSTLLWATRAAQPAAGAPGLLGRDTLALVTSAVLAQCDTIDGVADGVLEDPRQCDFDPAQLQCSASSTGESCLSPEQARAVRQIYAGPSDAASGLDLPGYAPGGETGWGFANGPDLSTLALDFFRRAVFADPNWDWRSFDFGADYALAQAETGWIMDSDSPALLPFRDNGGKLLIYHGWNDSGVSPHLSIRYYDAVAATVAEAANPDAGAADFARLFLVPGMGHCGGGTGTADFDAQRAIEDWVERGIAPDRIEASRSEDGQTIRTRPLCPYPQIAQYQGSGDTDDAENFVCAE